MPDYTDKPGYAFKPGPPPEASGLLKNKGWKPAFSWQDVEPEEHAVAFTVAKAMEMDVLRDIREEVQTALDEGLPFAEFQKRLRPRLQARGWWGRKDMADSATGETVEVQLGRPRRLRTIYRANIRSARAAGQWERIERTKAALPYLQYNLGPSEHHCPEHAAKEGLVLPVDDPFWDAWMPPNGWGCKCWVRQISSREAARLGLSEAPDVPLIDRVNARTGEARRVTDGIDPGWERNPGKLRLDAAQRLLREKVLAADPDVAAAALRDMASSWRVQRIAKGAPGSLPIAMIPDHIAARAGAPRIVSFTDRTAAHLFKDKVDRALDDLPELGLMARAETFALSVDDKGQRALHVLIEEAADPDSVDPRRRNAIAVVLYFAAEELFLATRFRVAKTRWEKRARRLGWTFVGEN